MINEKIQKRTDKNGTKYRKSSRKRVGRNNKLGKNIKPGPKTDLKTTKIAQNSPQISCEEIVVIKNPKTEIEYPQNLTKLMLDGTNKLDVEENSEDSFNIYKRKVEEKYESQKKPPVIAVCHYCERKYNVKGIGSHQSTCCPHNRGFTLHDQTKN